MALRLVVVLCGVSMGSWRMPWPNAAPAHWLALAAPQGLPSRYNLAVVPMPPPPKWSEMLSGCPVIVRGVVVAELRENSFAVVVPRQNVDDSSQLVRVGQKLQFAGASWQVQEIQSEQLVLAQGNSIKRCTLAESTR